MATITYPDGTAIGKTFYYTPSLFASVFICSRHGFLKSSGWFFLVTFCITRLIGSCAQLATINNHHLSTAETISLICSFLGTSPLLLSSLGLLARVYYSIFFQPWSTLFQLGALKAIQNPAIIALILCILGATSAPTPSQISSEPMVRAGIILFCVVYLLLVLLTFITVLCRKKVLTSERILIKAVAAALPLIFVHLLYSLISAFGHYKNFNAATGSPTAALCMSVIEEMVVVAIYICAGLKFRSTPLDDDMPAARKLGYRLGRGDFGTGKLGLLSLVFGLVGAVGERRESATMEEERSRRGGHRTSRSHSHSHGHSHRHGRPHHQRHSHEARGNMTRYPREDRRHFDQRRREQATHYV